MATAASATAFGAAVRRVVVTPTFAAGLGVVIAAAMSYPMTKTVISYGGTPPVGGNPCLATGCGTGTRDGSESLATTSPDSRLAPPAPAATRPGSPAPAATGGSGQAASGREPVMQYKTLDRWESGFIGRVTIAVPGGSLANWQLRLSYQSAHIVGVWGGRWSHSGDHTVLVTPGGGDGSGGDSVQVLLAVDGTPGPPSGCSLNGRACSAGQVGESTWRHNPQQGSHQRHDQGQGGPQQHGSF